MNLSILITKQRRRSLLVEGCVCAVSCSRANLPRTDRKIFQHLHARRNSEYSILNSRWQLLSSWILEFKISSPGPDENLALLKLNGVNRWIYQELWDLHLKHSNTESWTRLLMNCQCSWDCARGWPSAMTCAAKGKRWARSRRREWSYPKCLRNRFKKAGRCRSDRSNPAFRQRLSCARNKHSAE